MMLCKVQKSVFSSLVIEKINDFFIFIFNDKADGQKNKIISKLQSLIALSFKNKGNGREFGNLAICDARSACIYILKFWSHDSILSKKLSS